MRPIPPLIAVLYLGAAWGVHRLVPGDPMFETGRLSLTAACTLIALGIALAIWAAVQFNRADTTKDPYGTPTKLVTSGPFAYTRNPMYVGMTIVLLGVGILLAEAVYIAVPVAFLATVSKWFVPREEKLLAELFPAEFAKYREEIRRWI